MKLYELDIDGNETEVYFNSIVNIPAHMKAALKFNAAEKPRQFQFNEELQVMSGVMIAVDEPIYRYNPETKEEFNVVFRKSIADKVIRDYMRKGYANRLNLDHVEGNDFKSAYLMEIYQIDKSRGNSVPEAFASQNLQDGSIIVSYHIPDATEWAAAKQRGGFSIEGNFELIEVTNTNSDKMSLLEKLGFGKPKQNKETFAKSAQKFGEATLEDGTVIYWDGDLAEGVDLFVDVDGVMTPAPDGTHVFSTGEIVETSGGVIVTYTGIQDDDMQDDKKEEEEFAKVSDVVAAFEAFEAKLMDVFSAKIKEVSESFEAKLQAKNEQFEALKSQFEDVKKIAPSPAKEKFQAPKPKPSGAAKVDLLDMVRVKRD